MSPSAYSESYTTLESPGDDLVQVKADTSKLSEEMLQRLADDDKAYRALHDRVAGLNLFMVIKDYVPYKKAPPRDIQMSYPRPSDPPLLQMVFQRRDQYLFQMVYAKQYQEMATEKDDAGDYLLSATERLGALGHSQKASALASDHLKAIETMLSGLLKVEEAVYKKRADAALQQASLRLKHEMHKDVMRTKGVGDPLQASSDDLARIAGGGQ